MRVGLLTQSVGAASLRVATVALVLWAALIPGARASCLAPIEDRAGTRSYQPGWTQPARLGGAGAAAAGTLTLVVLGGATASATTAIPAAAATSVAGSLASAYAFGCGALIAGTAGAVLVAGGGLIYITAVLSEHQHLKSVERLGTALFEVQDNRPLLPKESVHDFELWANDLSWRIFDATDRAFFPHERDIASALRDLNQCEDLCPGGQLLGLRGLEKAVIAYFKKEVVSH